MGREEHRGHDRDWYDSIAEEIQEQEIGMVKASRKPKRGFKTPDVVRLKRIQHKATTEALKSI